MAAQFETSTEFGSLLRANTPVSRMMTTYTRRGPGQAYLKSVLSEKINSLVEHKDLNLEINPLKVSIFFFSFFSFSYLLFYYMKGVKEGMGEEEGGRERESDIYIYIYIYIKDNIIYLHMN